MIFKQIFVTIAATMAMAVSADAAGGRSYSGNWPLTITHSRGANGNYCLTLTDNGSLGWRHSGQASLRGVGDGGTFQVIGHTLVATIQSPGASGQNEGLVFVASAENGSVGTGIYEGVYGGEEIDSGVLTFGMKGGC
ncbi:MAG: hypothetical protein JO190_07630 [Candidatus Eremiobacteraeota bacterium]|nr:hypothetical protein [Candidatus Eremiobacteraeota bacterium]MBV8498643.1 hypothetical protein [Candidatus Eremiobacteraeota bacterium]